MGGGVMNLKSRGVCILFIMIVLFTRPAAAAGISLAVRDADIREVLMSLGAVSGQPIAVSDSVHGRISLTLDEADFSSALAVVTGLGGLAVESCDGVVLVGTRADMQSGFARLHVIDLHFADPEDVAAALSLLPGMAGIDAPVANTKKEENSAEHLPAVSVPRAFVLDKIGKRVLLFGPDDAAAAAEKLVRALDTAPRQISLEAKVVAVEKEAAKKLGLEWNWSKLPQYPEHHFRERSEKSPAAGENNKDQEVRRSFNGDASAGILQFGRGPEGYPFEFYYSAQLNALITGGKANVLARPNIMTLEGKEAVINIGGEVPVPTVATTNATTTTSVSYREAGIILRYTPWVNEDGLITAQVHTEVSSPVYVEELKAYRFQKRSADTTVRLKDGETMVIGGLIGSEESKSLSKIPFLGDMPVLGQFFRSERSSKTETEIMIFLTAHIMD